MIYLPRTCQIENYQLDEEVAFRLCEQKVGTLKSIVRMYRSPTQGAIMLGDRLGRKISPQLQIEDVRVVPQPDKSDQLMPLEHVCAHRIPPCVQVVQPARVPPP